MGVPTHPSTRPARWRPVHLPQLSAARVRPTGTFPPPNGNLPAPTRSCRPTGPRRRYQPPPPAATDEPPGAAEVALLVVAGRRRRCRAVIGLVIAGGRLQLHPRRDTANRAVASDAREPSTTVPADHDNPDHDAATHHDADHRTIGHRTHNGARRTGNNHHRRSRHRVRRLPQRHR